MHKTLVNFKIDKGEKDLDAPPLKGSAYPEKGPNELQAYHYFYPALSFSFKIRNLEVPKESHPSTSLFFFLYFFIYIFPLSSQHARISSHYHLNHKKKFWRAIWNPNKATKDFHFFSFL